MESETPTSRATTLQQQRYHRQHLRERPDSSFSQSRSMADDANQSPRGRVLRSRPAEPQRRSVTSPSPVTTSSRPSSPPRFQTAVRPLSDEQWSMDAHAQSSLRLVAYQKHSHDEDASDVSDCVSASSAGTGGVSSTVRDAARGFSNDSNHIQEEDSPGVRENNGRGTTSNDSTSSEKPSRYLREMDRREILARIDKGEKQSALAKEYHISRSAVCNLNKKRDQVLARQCDNPFSKHPKLSHWMDRTTPTKDSSIARAHAHADDFGSSFAHQRKAPRSLTVETCRGVCKPEESRSAGIALLVTTVLDRDTTTKVFQRSVDRLMRLVLEEALAFVPLSSKKVFLSNNIQIDGVSAANPTCAISLEQDRCPMLDLLHVVEPEMSSGYARINLECSESARHDDQAEDEESTATITILDAHLPKCLDQHNLLLLDTVIRSGSTLCQVIDTLNVRGAIETSICIVTLFISRDAEKMVTREYSGVKICAAELDASVGPATSAAKSESFRTRLRALHDF